MPKYNWNAADYDRHSQAQQGWARELIVKLNLRGEEHVLDVGCGDGKVSAELAASVPDGSVIGVDSSEDMIHRATEKYPCNEYANLSFAVMDAMQLTFANQFDVVFSNAALHWVPDHAKVLAGVAHGLKTGGRILFQMGGEGNASRVIAAMETVQAQPQWRSHFANFQFPYTFHGPDTYRSLLTDAGLTPKRLELVPKDMQHADRAAFEGWLRTTWLPYTQQVPEDRRDAFLTEASTIYLEKTPADADGTVHVAMIRIEVEAVK